MKRRVGVLGVLIALFSGSAQAHVRTVLDADDSPGPLDIVAARLAHRDGELRLHVRTYESWPDDTLEDRKNFVGFQFNLDGDSSIDRCVIVKLPPEEEGPTAIEGGVYRDDCLTRVSKHPGNVFRNQPNGLTVILARKKIGTLDFRWRAVTGYEEEGHPDCDTDIGPEPRYGTCSDFTRWGRHRSE